jgi:hypothetical protein
MTFFWVRDRIKFSKMTRGSSITRAGLIFDRKRDDVGGAKSTTSRYRNTTRHAIQNADTDSATIANTTNGRLCTHDFPSNNKAEVLSAAGIKNRKLTNTPETDQEPKVKTSPKVIKKNNIA